jgi:hypothetical protein
MRKVTIYQSIPVYKPKPTIRLISYLVKNNYCKPQLDIEDSIQDIQNQELTPAMKSKAREDVTEILTKTKGIKYSVRINRVNSDEYHKDCELLHNYSDHFDTIVLPKIESESDLAMFNSDFNNNFKINIIIESQKGIDNLDEILSSKYAGRIEFVAFGNYDFHLDKNTYPINEQDSENYWDTIKPIVSVVEKYDKKFENSPYAYLTNFDCLVYSLHRLFQLCNNDFALTSLHKRQTLFYNRQLLELSPVKSMKNQSSEPYISIENYIDNKLKGRSFALDNSKIITPQEYLLLKRRQNG